MGRGGSAGGGQSSLGYIFGSGEAPKPAEQNGAAAPRKQVPVSTSNDNDGPPQKSTVSASSPSAVDVVTEEIFQRAFREARQTITSLLMGKTVATSSQ